MFGSATSAVVPQPTNWNTIKTVGTIFGVNVKKVGQWFRHSWQSSCFQHQRSAVTIQSLAIFQERLFIVNCIEKTENKENETEKAPFLKN